MDRVTYSNNRRVDGRRRHDRQHMIDITTPLSFTAAFTQESAGFY